ncbi:MAG: VOC family protein [Chloroflexi bacterium]|nr:MAG: VOC family protein [Chloroflexota bacterium]
MLAIDHVVLPVANLALAGAEIEARYRLTSVAGGRHPAWGTANRIVPLGDSYVELVAVADRETADQTAFGRWIAAARPGRPLGWAVRTDAIDAVGRRLGLPVVPGFRDPPGGRRISWRSAGVEVATREPALPFFIQWGDGVPLPGATTVRHPGGPARLKVLSLTADPARLAAWLGEHDLPLAVATGRSRVSAVLLRQGRRDFALLIQGLPAESQRIILE